MERIASFTVDHDVLVPGLYLSRQDGDVVTLDLRFKKPNTDTRTYQRYGDGQPKSTWRSANVDRCVQAVHDAVKAVRPWIKLSCSPVGKYADLSRYSSFGWMPP